MFGMGSILPILGSLGSMFGGGGGIGIGFSLLSGLIGSLIQPKPPSTEELFEQYGINSGYGSFSGYSGHELPDYTAPTLSQGYQNSTGYQFGSIGANYTKPSNGLFSYNDARQGVTSLNFQGNLNGYGQNYAQSFGSFSGPTGDPYTAMLQYGGQTPTYGQATAPQNNYYGGYGQASYGAAGAIYNQYAGYGGQSFGGYGGQAYGNYGFQAPRPYLGGDAFSHHGQNYARPPMPYLGPDAFSHHGQNYGAPPAPYLGSDAFSHHGQLGAFGGVQNFQQPSFNPPLYPSVVNNDYAFTEYVQHVPTEHHHHHHHHYGNYTALGTPPVASSTPPRPVAPPANGQTNWSKVPHVDNANDWPNAANYVKQRLTGGTEAQQARYHFNGADPRSTHDGFTPERMAAWHVFQQNDSLRLDVQSGKFYETLPDGTRADKFHISQVAAFSRAAGGNHTHAHSQIGNFLRSSMAMPNIGFMSAAPSVQPVFQPNATSTAVAQQEATLLNVQPFPGGGGGPVFSPFG